MKRFFLGVLAGVLLIAGSGSGAAYAQTPADADSITLSPVSRKYSLEAGQTVEDKLTVVNDGKTAYDIAVYSRPYSVTNEAYEPDFTKTPANADAYGWVKFPKTKYRLEAGQSIEVPFSMTVPANAKPGGHYGVVFAETQPDEAAANGNAVIRKKRVGAILYATVKGDFITKGQLDSTHIPFWQPQPPLHAESRATNSGNSDFVNATEFTVKDVFGNTKFTQIKEFTLLPGTSRVMSFDWNGASWLGFYKVELKQTVLGKTSVDSGYVLLLPRYLPVLLVVVLLIGGAYAWFRHKKK